MKKIINPLATTYKFRNSKGDVIEGTIVSAEPLLIIEAGGKMYTANLSIDYSGNNGNKCHHIHFSTGGDDFYTSYWSAVANDFPIYCLDYREYVIDDDKYVRVDDNRQLLYYTYDAVLKDYSAFFRAYEAMYDGNKITNRKEKITEEELPYTNGSRKITYCTECLGRKKTITVRMYIDYPENR